MAGKVDYTLPAHAHVGAGILRTIWEDALAVKRTPVMEMSWLALNAALMKCGDEVILRHWLDAMLVAGRDTRVLRIYSRYVVVRRERELKELRSQLKLRRKGGTRWQKKAA